MKRLTVHLKYLAVAASSLACLGTFAALAEEASDPVTIENERILIPGTNISENDQRAVNAILAKYDKSLYKLKGYVNGKPGKQQGTMNDASIDKATAKRAATHGKDPHFTGWTLQVGATANQNSSAGVTTNQNSNAKPGTTTNQNASAGVTSNQNSNASPSPSPGDGGKARELVKRLTPILQKYSKARSKK
jgi:hypothetical protein